MGLLTQTVRPPVAYDCIPPGLRPGRGRRGDHDEHLRRDTNDLATTTNGNGWVTAYGYDGHHGVVTTTQQISQLGRSCRPRPLSHHAARPSPGAAGPRTVVNPTDGIARRGSLTSYDPSAR